MEQKRREKRGALQALGAGAVVQHQRGLHQGDPLVAARDQRGAGRDRGAGPRALDGGRPPQAALQPRGGDRGTLPLPDQYPLHLRGETDHGGQCDSCCSTPLRSLWCCCSGSLPAAARPAGRSWPVCWSSAAPRSFLRQADPRRPAGQPARTRKRTDLCRGLSLRTAPRGRTGSPPFCWPSSRGRRSDCPFSQRRKSSHPPPSSRSRCSGSFKSGSVFCCSPAPSSRWGR